MNRTGESKAEINKGIEILPLPKFLAKNHNLDIKDASTVIINYCLILKARVL